MTVSSSSMQPLDRLRLQEAVILAETSFGLTEPNPRVGCVIGTMEGRVLGQGATQQAGGPHAEIVALREASALGNDVRGAVAWVTLEPCAHHGRTPPCCDALIAAGLGRVVVAVTDPFPAVNGAGVARLRTAGVEVVMADGALQAAARDVNIGFFSRIQRGRPWVRLKVATSLDGMTALLNGQSQWITGEEARRDGHAWRRRASAVLTGIGTVLADDPQLDVRWVHTAFQPARVVLDSAFRTPPQARLLKGPGTTHIIGARQIDHAPPALRASTAQLHAHPGANGRVELGAALSALGAMCFNEVHVEAGAELNGALLAGGWVDELLVYVAPRLLGAGRPFASLPPVESLAQSWDFVLIEANQLGPDLRIRGLTKSSPTLDLLSSRVRVEDTAPAWACGVRDRGNP